MRFVHHLFILTFVIQSISSFSQDSLIFKNKDYITGEIKSMDRGVLTIETDYSKSDFTVEWIEIKEIYTKTYFMVTLSNGDRLSGTLQSTDSVHVTIGNGSDTQHSINDIVMLKTVSDKFWDQINAGISLGLSITRAQSLKQFTLRSNVGYVRERWSLEATFNNLRSTQDDVEPIRRKDGGLVFTYFLPRDWYIPVSINFLSNTEQKLDLRLNRKFGIGKYLLHKNRAYWGISAGGNYSSEDFSDETPDRDSWEGFFGTELNLFDIGDLSLLTRAVAYPSFTESGRWRADFLFDTKYEFPYDIYIQFGITINFDNRPAEGAPETDYVFQTTLGWSW